MRRHVISCYPSGMVEAVQNDEIPLHSLGRSQMERASDVTWNGGAQVWCAVIREEFRNPDTKYYYANKSRAKCIEWEIGYLNNR